MSRVLVTGSGGVAGVNFVRAIKKGTDHFVVGTEFNKYFSVFPEVDRIVNTPRHSDPEFVKIIKGIIREYGIEFLHPQPTSEMLVLLEQRDDLGARVYLPSTMVVQRDKYAQYQALAARNVRIPKFATIDSEEKLDGTLGEMGLPLWVRAKSGAGGRLSIRCESAEEMLHWIKLWVLKGRAKWSDFVVQQYLPGRDIAWDSLWYEGRLVTSFCRQRLDYPFKHLTPSGKTGTPTVSKIIHDKKINTYAEAAVRAIDERPHGCYSVDLKEDADGNAVVTEIDSGKFHTTIGLWGYVAMSNLGMDWRYNMPQLYLHLGLGGKIPEMERYDIYPENLHLVRHMDCGVWIITDEGAKSRVL